VASLRVSLRRRLSSNPERFGQATHAEVKAMKPSEVHAIAAAKRVEADIMQRALRIRPDYNEGEAFDQELQERRKMERMDERARRKEGNLRERRVPREWRRDAFSPPPRDAGYGSRREHPTERATCDPDNMGKRLNVRASAYAQEPDVDQSLDYGSERRSASPPHEKTISHTPSPPPIRQ